MKARTVNAWCVVNAGGHPFMNSVRPLRKRAIIAYAQTSDPEEWKHLRSVYGVRVVRCSLTTEPR